MKRETLPMRKIDRTNKRFFSAVMLCGILAASMLTGAGTASAAPAGFSGPFTGACKGFKQGEHLLGIGQAKLEVWRDSSGSGTVCAKTSDNLPGAHWMGVTLGRTDWATTFTDHANYSEYAGAIYVSMANMGEFEYATIVGWVEYNDTVYSSGVWGAH